jgi:hypothetical protein
MTDEPLACPYCNASVPVAPGTPAGERVTCPRCGDAFTLLRPAGEYAPAPAPDPEPPGPGQRRSNRVVAAMVLGVMACMAAGGLALALWTQQERRAHDAGLPGKHRRAPQPAPEGEPPTEGVAPDKLEALGYLAPGTDLVLGVHVADLLATPLGRKTLESRFALGKAEFKLDTFAAWTGLRPEDIDHLVLGLKLDESLPPRLHLVVRTKERIDPEDLRARLKGQKLAGTGSRVVFRYSPPNRALPLAMFCPDDRTAVVAILAPHLDSVPQTPAPDLGQLPDEVRTVLRERRELGAHLWVVAHAANWNKTPARALLDRMKKQERDRLAQVRTQGLWVQLDPAVTLKGCFRCQDEAGARALDEYFHAPGQAANPTLKTVLDGPWLNVQLRTDLAGLQKILTP